MKHYRLDVIECGETTCYARPGVPCKHLHSLGMQGKYACGVFGDLVQDKDGGYEGWLMRLPACLEEFKQEKP